MSKTWILVAESSRAKIFEQEAARGDLREMQAFDHAASRLNDSDLVSAPPGRTYDSNGMGRHAMEPDTDPKVNETHIFARILAQHLDKTLDKNHVKKLVVIAPPEFLGILRDSFSAHVSKMIAAEINKNLVKESAESILGHLPFSF
jgi:protein required for attachment to host cells